MSASAPGTSGASVTSTMRPPAASWRRSKSSALAGLHVRARMRAARTVLGREVRPFHVDPGDGGVRHRGEDARARGEVLEGRGDERGQQRVTPYAPHPLERQADAIGRQVRRVEVDAGEAVGLEIEEPRERDPHDWSRSRHGATSRGLQLRQPTPGRGTPSSRHASAESTPARAATPHLRGRRGPPRLCARPARCRESCAPSESGAPTSRSPPSAPRRSRRTSLRPPAGAGTPRPAARRGMGAR